MSADDFHEALFYGKEGNGDTSLRCFLCPNLCTIQEGSAGRCHVRVNEGGVLRAASYGVVSALSLDPIEKKPFAQFFPGTRILSTGSYGCNLSCKFCQNHEISQRGPTGVESSSYMSPEELVKAALDAQSGGNIGLAYTYNEPFVGYEFVKDTALLIKDAGLHNVLVTNGYVNHEPLVALMPFIDAINVDLKSFSDSFYRFICGGKLSPVMKNIETIAKNFPSCHIEITTLVIPGLNSSKDEIESLASWLASISSDIPLHLSRHHPDYLLPSPESISREELLDLAEVARFHLRTVLCGNMQK